MIVIFVIFVKFVNFQALKDDVLTRKWIYICKLFFFYLAEIPCQRSEYIAAERSKYPENRHSEGKNLVRA